MELISTPLSVEAHVPLFAEGTVEPSLTSPWFSAASSTSRLSLDLETSADAFGTLVDATLMGYGSGSGLELWRVASIEEHADNGAHVRLEHKGVQEVLLDMNLDAALQLEQGNFIVQPERLARKAGFLGFGRAEVSFEPDLDQEPWESDCLLPVLRIHRPKRRGCNANFEITQSTERQSATEFSAIGLGFGDGVTWTTMLKTEYPAPSRCIEICHPARLRIEWGSTAFNGAVVAYGTRVSIIDIDEERMVDQGIPPGLDGCNRPFEQIPGDQRVTDLVDKTRSKRGESDTQSFSFSRQDRGRVKVGLSIGKAPVSMGIELARSTTHEMTVATTLGPGATYLGYTPSRQGRLELCWTAAESA